MVEPVYRDRINESSFITVQCFVVDKTPMLLRVKKEAAFNESLYFGYLKQ